MQLSGREQGFGVIVQIRGVLLLSFLGQFCVDLHDHAGVRMAHPGLQCFDLYACFIADRAEGDSEIMTADLDVFLSCKDYFPAVPETKSEVVIPISKDNKIMGGINSEATIKGYYSQEMIQKLQGISNELADLLEFFGYTEEMTEKSMPSIGM